MVLQLGAGLHGHFPLCARIFCLWACAGLVSTMTNFLSLFLQLFCCLWEAELSLFIPDLWVLESLLPLPQWFLGLGEREAMCITHIWPKHSTVSYSLHLSQLRVSMWVTIYSEKLLWWRLRDPLISRYTKSHWEWIWYCVLLAEQ